MNAPFTYDEDFELHQAKSIACRLDKTSHQTEFKVVSVSNLYPPKGPYEPTRYVLRDVLTLEEIVMDRGTKLFQMVETELQKTGTTGFQYEVSAYTVEPSSPWYFDLKKGVSLVE